RIEQHISRVIYLLCDISLFIQFASFFFDDTATTEIYTLSLHDALPIYCIEQAVKDAQTEDCIVIFGSFYTVAAALAVIQPSASGDRKSTRLNSSHVKISYAVFCLKKKIKGRAYTRPSDCSRH